MRYSRTHFLSPVAAALSAAVYTGTALPASAQARRDDGPVSSLVDEVRFGVLAHSIEPSNAEDGTDINLEVLFRQPTTTSYNSALLDVLLRPRLHLGASINTVGDTSQLYGGLTWDVRVAQRLSLELTFGGALHDGPTGRGYDDSYGCPVNFRESLSVGYALGDRWMLYGTVAHMSNGELCHDNTGISSVGARLGYKLK